MGNEVQVFVNHRPVEIYLRIWRNTLTSPWGSDANRSICSDSHIWRYLEGLGWWIFFETYSAVPYCTLSRQCGYNMSRFLCFPGLMGLGCAAFWELWRAYHRHMYHNTISMFSFCFLSTVPAPDVWHCLQLRLDQQGQMLWPPVYGKGTPGSTQHGHKDFLKTCSICSAARLTSLTCSQNDGRTR